MQNRVSFDCIEEFKQLCKSFGLKITPQRCAVYKTIIQKKNHPTAEEIFNLVKKKFPNVSYDTVNRTLLTLAEIGLVDIVSSRSQPRRFDPDRENHHHFHCLNCGKIIDFYSDAFDNLEIPDRIQDDLTVFTKRVVLNGLCRQCRKKGLENRSIVKQNK